MLIFAPHQLVHNLGKEPRNCIFSLKHCMLLCQQTHKTHYNYNSCNTIQRTEKSVTYIGTTGGVI